MLIENISKIKGKMVSVEWLDKVVKFMIVVVVVKVKFISWENLV